MRRRTFLFVFGILFLAAPTRADKRAFTIEDFYSVRGIEDLDVSPDGQTILCTISSTDLARATRTEHIWRINADGTNAQQLTFGDAGESSPIFSPDGKSIAFISSRNLYFMSPTGGTPRQLTNISTGISDPRWSPDGKWIVFSSEVYPECGADDDCNKKIRERWNNGPLHAHLANALLYRHLNRWKDGKRAHILIADVSSGEVRDLTPGDFDAPNFQGGGPSQYDFSPDSTELAFDSNHDSNPESSTNADLWIVPVSGAAQPRDITALNRAFDGNPKYSPDGKFIAYRMQMQPGYEADLFRLAIYDRSTGASRVLTESFRNWVEDFHWSPDSSSIYFSAPLEGNNPVFQVTLKSLSIQRVLTDSTIDSFCLTRDGRWIAYTRSSIDEPVEVFRAAVTSGNALVPQQISHFNAPVRSSVDLRPAETMWVKGAGDAKIEVFVVKPHNFDPSKRYPLILNVHAGPQQHWTNSFSGDGQVFPGAGYILAFANPHGSTGYGQDFTAEISGDWGGKVYEDLMMVTDKLSQLPYVDADRLGAMGWSYGGYMMGWFEGQTDRFKALVAMMGAFDLRSFYGETEELWFPGWDMKGQPWNSEDYEKFSPSYYVKNFKTPCLVIAGENDFRVPAAQQIQFFTALQKMNVPSRLIDYSQAGHRPNWYEMALYYTAHLEWFHQYLGGVPPPWTTEQFVRNSVFDPTTGQRIK